MDTSSVMAIAVVFFSGTAVGALLTAMHRFASQRKIQRAFQEQLETMIETREFAVKQRVHAEAPKVASHPDIEDPATEPDESDEEQLAWIALQSGSGTAIRDHARL
jgi:hypothetical protein